MTQFLNVSQLLKELAARAGNVDSSRHATLAVFDPLDDSRVLAALRAGGGFRGVHDLLAVGCLCDFHSRSPDRNVPPARRPGFYLVIGEYHGMQAPTQTLSPAGWHTREALRLYSPREVYTMAARLSESQMSVVPAFRRSSQIHEAQVARLFVHRTERNRHLPDVVERRRQQANHGRDKDDHRR